MSRIKDTVVPYTSFFNDFTGNPVASIIVVRGLYWMEKKDGQFYKFIRPCNSFFYKDGDSWCEELNIPIGIFEGAMKKISSRIKLGEKYNLFNEEYILKFQGGNNLTFYIINYPKLARIYFPKRVEKKYFKHFRAWKLQNPNLEKWDSEIEISSFRNTNFGFPIIQGNTQRTTNEFTQGKHPYEENKMELISPEKQKEKSSAQKEKVILPFESSGFKKVWEVWKNYRTKKNKKAYNAEAEMAALFPLGNYTEEFSIYLITKAISNGWKDFHFEDTPLKFKNLKYGKRDSIKGEYEPHVAELLK